jgi:hypothetical protein
MLIHALNQYPLYLIQRHLIVAPVIQPRGARRFMIRHALRDLELATVAQVLGDPGRTERVIANLCADAGRKRGAGSSETRRPGRGDCRSARRCEPASCETVSPSVRQRDQP